MPDHSEGICKRMRETGESRDEAPEDMAVHVYGVVHGLGPPRPGIVGGISAGW